MPPVVRIHNISKRYRLGGGGPSLLRRLWPGSAAATPPRDHWALRDVTLDVHAGNVVGVIGRNGAGKSTLLKVLSRITEPTSGRVELRGRVGSLLEVGIGFHSELTGRENVYQNGAILGMSRREVRRKFDEIVAFAEVDQFLDTPVKRYSTGMYVRLGFAVASSLDAEILIVDEVLAVGDAQFQQKCLGKMEDVARGGRTVFFVSHNMSAVQRLCNQVLYLESGRAVAYGERERVLPLYLADGANGHAAPGDWLDLTHAVRRGRGGAQFAAVRYRSGQQAAADHPFPEGPLDVSVAVTSDGPRTVESLCVTLWDGAGLKLIQADTADVGQPCRLRAGRNEMTLRIERLHLNPGRYRLGLALVDGGAVPLDQIDSAVEVEVVDLPSGGPGVRPEDDGLVPCPFAVTELA